MITFPCSNPITNIFKNVSANIEYLCYLPLMSVIDTSTKRINKEKHESTILS